MGLSGLALAYYVLTSSPDPFLAMLALVAALILECAAVATLLVFSEPKDNMQFPDVRIPPRRTEVRAKELTGRYQDSILREPPRKRP